MGKFQAPAIVRKLALKRPLRSHQIGNHLLHLCRWSQLTELLQIQKMKAYKRQEIPSQSYLLILVSTQF